MRAEGLQPAGGRGMGSCVLGNPIPTPTLPLKGRENNQEKHRVRELNRLHGERQKNSNW